MYVCAFRRGEVGGKGADEVKGWELHSVLPLGCKAAKQHPRHHMLADLAGALLK